MHIPWETVLRTTIDLPESLVKEAMEASNQKTKTAVIIAALEDYVRKSKIQGLKKFRGRVRLDIDLNALRKRA
jgi:Arc/MetJ family transcription regulator